MLPQRPRKALRNLSGIGSPVTACVTSAVVFLMKKTAHNKYVLKYIRLCVLFVPLKTPSLLGGTRPTPSRPAGPLQAAGAPAAPGPTQGDSVPSSVRSQFWMPATLSRYEREELSGGTNIHSMSVYQRFFPENAQRHFIQKPFIHRHRAQALPQNISVCSPPSLPGVGFSLLKTKLHASHDHEVSPGRYQGRAGSSVPDGRRPGMSVTPHPARGRRGFGMNGS